MRQILQVGKRCFGVVEFIDHGRTWTGIVLQICETETPRDAAERLQADLVPLRVLLRDSDEVAELRLRPEWYTALPRCQSPLIVEFPAVE